MDSMSALGIETKKTQWYLDVLTRAQNSSNTTAMQLGEAYIACGNTLNNMGIPLEESATILGGMANQGIKASEAGNGLNSVLINLMGTTDTTSGALEKLGVKAYDDNGNFRGLRTVLEDCKKSMSNMTNEQKDMIAAALGGKTRLTEFQAMLNVTGDTYDNLYGKISDCDGALEEMYSTMTDNTKGNWTELKDMAESVGLELANDLLPVCNDLLDVAKSFVDWFGSLDEGTRKLIVSTGLLTFATGGLFKGIGNLVSGFGNVKSATGKMIEFFAKFKSSTSAASQATESVSSAMKVMSGATTAATAGGSGLLSSMAAFGPVLGAVGSALAIAGVAIAGYNTYQGLLDDNVLKSTEDMSLFERAVASVTGIERYSNQQLEEMGLKYKEFSNDIAPETQQTLEDTAEKFRNIQLEIDKIDLKKAITNEDTEDLKNKADELCQSIINQLDNMKSESRTKLEEAFKADGIIDEQEKKILESMDKNKNNILSKIQEIQQNVDELQSSGRMKTEEGYAQYQEDISQLQDLYQQQYLEKEKANQEDINAFRQQSNDMSLEAASEILTKQSELRDKDIENAKEHYDMAINALKSHLEECSGEEARATQEQIDKLTENKEREIGIARDKYDGYLEVIKEKYPEIFSNINQYTGEILTDEDKKCQQSLEKIKNHYMNMDSITESGCYKMFNIQNKTWQDVCVTVDEKTGEIIGLYNKAYGDIGGYSKGIADSTMEMANSASSSAGLMSQAIYDLSQSTVSANGSIVSSNGQVIGSLKEVKRNSDDTRLGILNINGTPIQIHVNAQGAITNLDEVRNRLNGLKDRWVNVKVNYQAVGDIRYASGHNKDMGANMFAKGTDNAPYGMAYVAEEGPELILNKERTMATLVSNMSLVKMMGGEQVLTAAETRKILSNKNINGGYFNSNSLKSQNLVRNTVTNTNNTFNENKEFDFKKLGEVIGAALQAVLGSQNFGEGLNLKGLANALNPYITKANNKRFVDRRFKV